MKVQRKQTRWITYSLPVKEFCEKLGLPPKTNIVTVFKKIQLGGDAIEITCIDASEQS